MQRLCNVDGELSMAFVATIDNNGLEEEVGVSRYSADEIKGASEMAVTIADEWQGIGLGELLVKHLIGYAKSHGVTQLYSMEHKNNAKMRDIAIAIGMEATPDPQDSYQVIYSKTLIE